MATGTVHATRDSNQLASLLDSPEIASLVAKLQETRWTGRPGYPLRAMIGMALVKALYSLPTWSRVARLVADRLHTLIPRGTQRAHVDVEEMQDPMSRTVVDVEKPKKQVLGRDETRAEALRLDRALSHNAASALCVAIERRAAHWTCPRPPTSIRPSAATDRLDSGRSDFPTSAPVATSYT